MASKLFLDANILLDFTLKRQAYNFAEAIIQQGLDGKVQLFTTPAVIHITSYWFRKYYGTEKTKEIIIALLDVISIIDCDHPTTIVALYSDINDIEDALQYFTALKHGVDYFLSADKKLKNASLKQLPVFSAEEYLRVSTG